METLGCSRPCSLQQKALARPRRTRKLSVSAVQTPQQEKQGAKNQQQSLADKMGKLTGLGDALGPIGMTYGSEVKESETRGSSNSSASTSGRSKTDMLDAAGVTLGPIGLTYGENAPVGLDSVDLDSSPRPQSIHSMTTAEWRAKYEKDGRVDLWVEEEFNAGSRLVGGRAVHLGGLYGFRTGEGPSAGACPTHKVVIHNHYADQVLEVEVPEDRYVLWEAEDNGLELPYACRMGCCTACAVRVVEGELYQPEALGISAELKAAGYALMCVGFPTSDCVLETVPEDEVYDLQFGRYFEEQALDPVGGNIERDDYALEIAQMDE